MDDSRIAPSHHGRLAGWRAAVRRAPLTAFFVFALGLTWIYHGIVLGLLHAPMLPWAIPGTFGPAIAGFLVVSVTEGREGVRRLRRSCRQWNVGARWYLLAGVALPALVMACGLVLPGGHDAFAGRSVPAVVAIYLVQLVAILLGGGGFNEEPGWRGFALPRLQRSAGPLKGTLVLGVLWGLWHLSLYVFTPDYNGAGTGFAGIAPMFLAFLVCTTALAVVFTWLYNSTGGSVFFLAFAHASFNAGSMWAPATRSYMLVLFALAVVLALAVLVGTRGRLGWKPDTTVQGAGLAAAAAAR